MKARKPTQKRSQPKQRVLERHDRLERKAGLPQGSICDEQTANAVRHELDYPEIYGSKKEE